MFSCPSGQFPSAGGTPRLERTLRSPAMTDPNALASFSSAVSGIVAKTAPAIVSIHSHRLRATGFVWKPGLVVTADEALADEGDVSIRFADGSERRATIAGRDHTTDVALLRVDTGTIAPTNSRPRCRRSVRSRSWSQPSAARRRPRSA